MRKFVLFLLIMAIAGGYTLNLRQTAQQKAVAAVEEFFALAIKGDTNAERFLATDMENRNAVLESLATTGLFQLTTAVIPEKTLPYRHATVTVHLLVGNSPYTMDVALERRDGEWQISSFPQLTVIPVALAIGTAGETVRFLDGAGTFTEMRLQAAGETAAGAGFAVGIDDTLVHFSAFEPLSVNKLLTITNNSLEGEESGFFPLADNAAFFRPSENRLKAATRDELIIGMQNLTVYLDGSQIRAVVLPESYSPEKIRVVLNTEGFGGLAHRSVSLTADTAFALADKVAGKRISFPAGAILSFSPEGESIKVTFPGGGTYRSPNRLFILPEKNGRIRFPAIRRGNPSFTPLYRGHAEIRALDGSLYIVNELPLEYYLYSVVPSEMPVSFGLVPLKAQALAARSYAVASMYRSGFRHLSAHVDDSTASQVYNNVPENPTASQAVDETAALIVTYDGSVADTRFFSTSSGITANFEEVWHDRATKSFPAAPVAYLKSHSQLRDGTLPDVAGEKGALDFFSRTDWDAYDRQSPWFRWEAEMTKKELEDVINRYLPERQKAQPEFVLTKAGSAFVQKEISPEPLGELLDLRIVSRGRGGNIMELEIVGTKGTYLLRKEYTIRFTLRPVRAGSGRDIMLRRHDGSTLANYSILPSAFFIIEIRRDGRGAIDTVLFRGGGNGHGVGLSQWGARGLADVGHSAEQIIRHYYPGTTLTRVY
ncbi:MAG: SpoIID/LytB domain-containing protein [Dethiobacter sp.]|nr:SpoIID/LytB domain-containing protein [Dethiobacter sp.]MBS3898266.1 SpoIID/LytB domain-containing protein [Dethiobacter sp.]